jgi:hypothetical protein
MTATPSATASRLSWPAEHALNAIMMAALDRRELRERIIFDSDV